MGTLYKMTVISPHLTGMARLFPDPEVARLKSLTRTDILKLGLSEIIEAADAGNLFADRFLSALEDRFAPEAETQ